MTDRRDMAGPQTSLPPAIVLGRGHTGLGALRSLVAAGIDTYVACPADDLATRSRWYRPLPGAAWDGGIGADTRQVLERLPIDGAVLIPGADDAALWLSDLAHAPLGSRFKTSSSSRQTLEILQDKQRFGAWLAEAGIPHPRTFAIASHADIAAIPFAELDRVFIKPADSQQFSSTLGVKGVWANGRREFEEAWDRLDAQGFKLIAQEYIPGSAADHYFIDGFRDRHGNFSGLFARRRLRIYPADFGNSSYCRSIPLQDVDGAVAHLAALLASLQYRGIFSAEFKRDARNGEFRILEVNTRAWWYVDFAAQCGVNVCRMAYEDACDLPVTAAAQPYPPGIGCVNLNADIRSVFAQRPPRDWSTILRQWRQARFHVFSWQDPRPGLAAVALSLRHGLRQAWRRLRAKPRAPQVGKVVS